MTEQWSDWLPHDGSGLPEGLYGKTVEVRTTGPFTGNAPDGTSALGIAGVTLIRSHIDIFHLDIRLMASTSHSPRY